MCKEQSMMPLTVQVEDHHGLSASCGIDLNWVVLCFVMHLGKGRGSLLCWHTVVLYEGLKFGFLSSDFGTVYCNSSST